MLFATVIGSGIMAEQLAGGNIALALLGNTLATAAMLLVLITMLGPVSGAQFNPAVTLVFALRRELSWRDAALYTVAQVIGGLGGAVIAHAMFDLPVFEIGSKVRTGPGQWLGEAVATFALVLTILGTIRHRPHWVPISRRGGDYGRLLVHLVDEFRQSGDHRGTVVDRQFFGHPPRRCAGVHHRATRRRPARRRLRPLAFRSKGGPGPQAPAAGGPASIRPHAASFAAARAMVSPWWRAPASSVSLGWRSPLPPAMVVAP